MRTPILVLWAGLTLVACGKKDDPAPAPAPTTAPSAGGSGSPIVPPTSLGRPLTDADADNYVLVAGEMKKHPGDADAIGRIATQRGLPMPEWMTIHARIAGALMGMRAGVTAADKPPNWADIEFVTKHRAKLEPTLDR